MAEELNTTTQTAVPPQPAAAPSTASSVPEDYEQLREFYNQYAPAVPTIQKIAEHWDDVRPLIEDEKELEYIRQARKARQRILEEQQPQLTPELKILRDEFEQKLTPLVEYVEQTRQYAQQSYKQQQDAALKANLDYAQRLCAERPELAERGYAGINMLAGIAARDGLSLEEAWKQNSGLFGRPVERHAPPQSLRGGAAAPGVPGESTQGPIKTRKDLKSRLAANLRAAGMKG